MTPSLYSQLLKELQKLEKAIVAERLATEPIPPATQAELERRHLDSEVGGSFRDFYIMSIRRDTVQLLLRTLYVRVLEDLGVLDPPRLRGELAYHYFHSFAPALGRRAWLEWVFADLSYDFPQLFPAPSYSENALSQALPLPGESLCEELWQILHRTEGGELLFQWQQEGFDSRFLGDLYQDLDGEVRKRYALLQTPHFVEQWILQHTLSPALKVFQDTLDGEATSPFRVLDPTCGSGHFLVGAFRHLASLWLDRGASAWEAATKALSSVWGCDLNPHAVDIAHFRLLLEVISFTGERSLEKLAALPFHLACLDSLIPWEIPPIGTQLELMPSHDRLSAYASPRERERSKAFLAGGFHVVVGNPPYITPKDVRKRDDYRIFWPNACHRSYSLSAPFAQRFFSLGVPGAFVGQITANSFMKREFGKPLIESVFRQLDLTGVIDTSGAYIPGHGTPTVILFGRAQPPQEDRLWVVLGKRGEPKRPLQPERGQVWQALVSARLPSPSDVGIYDDSSPFLSVAYLERSALAKHPWSLGGGETREVTSVLENASSCALTQVIADTGRSTHTGLDPVFIHSRPTALRFVGSVGFCDLVQGEDVRDFSITRNEVCLFPYDRNSAEARHLLGSEVQFYTRFKTDLRARVDFGNQIEARGLRWHEHSMFFARRYISPLSITFAFVATHNHFVLDRGGKVFKQTAPIIKLPPSASLDDHLHLLGLLNSSTLAFWMRQVCQGKGQSSEVWEERLEYDSTKLQRAPLVDADRAERVRLACALDASASARAACRPGAVLEGGSWDAGQLSARLEEARARYQRLTQWMVALQEELDWLTYQSYGLVSLLDDARACLPSAWDASMRQDEPLTPEPLMPGHRPFELRLARLDEEADPEEKTAWFERHGHARSLEVPPHYRPETRQRLEARLHAIEESTTLQLLEQPAFKRRWQPLDWSQALIQATEGWLLDRLEALFAPAQGPLPGGPLQEPCPYKLEEIVPALRRDPRVLEVTEVLAGTVNIDLGATVERLLLRESLSDNPYRIYTESGLTKWREWQRTWRLQWLEDQGQPLREGEDAPPLPAVPLPPRFEKTDFKRAEYFAVRGKLNVPRERFIQFTELRQPHFGWNGWRDLARAQAQAEAFARVESDPEQPLPAPTSEDPRRCGPTLGLWESLPDVQRWSGAELHEELSALAQEVCHQSRCPCPTLLAWQKWQETVKKGSVAPQALAAPRPVWDSPTEDSVARITLEERAQVRRGLALGGKKGITLPELLKHIQVDPARLELVLESLRADGLVIETGRGRSRRIAWKN